ncbi:MAG TPA: FHA domain-containing protein [Solirubrobacteraceae bacterium]|jgi:pSer/pThr/pTyr-binding forkhead associated (FHA) protein|nr:FHA domain-containing protein [Solirubrobacteraceae bacterium]
MTGFLHIETGGDCRVVPLDREVVHLGRGLSAEVRLDDATVSRRHAVIVRRPGGEVAILDDRSMNGVWVNGERVTEAVLSDGDEILLGRVPLRFAAAAPHAAAAA